MVSSETKYKKSRQRERIYELLKSTDTHPTAEWIYDRLKKEFKSLSMGTVYRNLKILLEQGLIIKLDFGSTFDRFDADVSPHYHFICEKCGAVLDLHAIPVETRLNNKVEKATGFKVSHHRTEFYGICDKCQPDSNRS